MRTTGWLQFNVALVRHGSDALTSARAVLRTFAAALAPLCQSGQVRGWFFMRKPPDLRLRAGHVDAERPLRQCAHAVLADLAGAGAVRGFFESVYEPEHRLFGGTDAMHCAHDYFAADSAAWLGLDLLRQERQRNIDDEPVVLAILCELFEEALEGPSEVWDVWSNLAEMRRELLAGPVPRLDVPGLDALLPVATPAEARWLQHQRGACATLARDLLAVWESGQLARGLRAVLGHIATFQLHRWGIHGPRQALLARAMADTCDPGRGLRGTAAEAPPAPRAHDDT
jgi:thiopeptide-type bacteriocin biosynthesis protein